MKFVHEFRTISGLASCIIDVTDETVKYLEQDGVAVELLGNLAKQKEELQTIFQSTLEIANKDIDKKTSEKLMLASLITLGGILDEYCKTVNIALHSMDLKHKDDILYFLRMTKQQSQTIANKIVNFPG